MHVSSLRARVIAACTCHRARVIRPRRRYKAMDIGSINEKKEQKKKEEKRQKKKTSRKQAKRAADGPAATPPILSSSSLKKKKQQPKMKNEPRQPPR
mmetsp:Transcript_38493/g.74676  ORF Transcript_38493/g.74676 Transcript_38493/m.74676 type:complete len:97 (+) Transcript_38493:1028-1318(+)